MRKPVVRKGDEVICENGHVVGVATRDIFLGDLNFGTAFEWHQNDAPMAGSFHIPACEQCGAQFIREGWQILFRDGWKPRSEEA